MLHSAASNGTAIVAPVAKDILLIAGSSEFQLTPRHYADRSAGSAEMPTRHGGGSSGTVDRAHGNRSPDRNRALPLDSRRSWRPGRGLASASQPLFDTCAFDFCNPCNDGARRLSGPAPDTAAQRGARDEPADRDSSRG